MKELFEVKVSSVQFDRILNNSLSLLSHDLSVMFDDMFKIVEIDGLDRILYARVSECKTFERTIKKRSWFIFSTKVVSHTSIFTFKLTGLMVVDGVQVPIIGEPSKDEIVKNINCGNKIDLSQLPTIYLMDDNNKVISEFNFIECRLNSDKEIENINISHSCEASGKILGKSLYFTRL